MIPVPNKYSQSAYGPVPGYFIRRLRIIVKQGFQMFSGSLNRFGYKLYTFQHRYSHTYFLFFTTDIHLCVMYTVLKIKSIRRSGIFLPSLLRLSPIDHKYNRMGFHLFIKLCKLCFVPT